MMNTEIRAKWVAALRSGEYEQGNGVLRDGDRYCCLGVLCDLAAREGVGQWDTDGVPKFIADGGVGYGLPPLAVQDWASLSENPDIRGVDGKFAPIALLNDSGLTFGEIADLIEAHL